MTPAAHSFVCTEYSASFGREEGPGTPWRSSWSTSKVLLEVRRARTPRTSGAEGGARAEKNLLRQLQPGPRLRRAQAGKLRDIAAGGAAPQGERKSKDGVKSVVAEEKEKVEVDKDDEAEVVEYVLADAAIVNKILKNPDSKKGERQGERRSVGECVFVNDRRGHKEAKRAGGHE